MTKFKLKSWWFQGAIAVKEHCEVQERTQVHVFDQWCYLGTLEAQDGLVSVEDLKPPRFDIDHYKILRRLFAQPRNPNTELIELRSLDELSFYGA